MATDNRKLIDEYFEALCDENFVGWNRFQDFVQQLTDNDKPYFLEKWKKTASFRQVVDILKEGGMEKLDEAIRQKMLLAF